MVQFFCLVLKLLNQFSLDVPVSQIYNHNLSFSHFCFALVPRAGEPSKFVLLNVLMVSATSSKDVYPSVP